MSTKKQADPQAFAALLNDLMAQENLSNRELACEVRHIPDGGPDAVKYGSPMTEKTVERWRKGEHPPRRREFVLQLISILRLPQREDKGQDLADRLLRSAGHQELNDNEILRYFPAPQISEKKPGSSLFFSAEDLAALETDLLALQQAQVQESGVERGKKLRELQTDIYQRFNNLEIHTFSDFQSLAEQERHALKQEILTKMAGLEQRPENLLDTTHVNTRFPEALLRSRRLSWEMLHRKTAIYSDLALIDIQALTVHARGGYASHGYLPEQAMLADETINLLLLHRPLIEQGKMSVVPEVLKRVEANGRESTLFKIDDLKAIEVNLKDKEIQSAFFEQGKLFQPAGNLVFKSPHGMGLNLEQILEIIKVKYPKEYEYFQFSLRKTMRAVVNPEDDTRALRHAIQAVDEGILELEVKYENAKSRFNQPAPGGLALVLYATEGDEIASFVKAAFQGSKLSEMVSFAPTAEAIPPEIKESPFFIPWFIRHQNQMTQDLSDF